MEILKCIALVLLLFSIGLLIEKMVHNEYSLYQLTQQLRKDMVTIIKALLGKPVRHIFHPQLAEEFKKVVKPYVNPAFETGAYCDYNYKPPFVGIQFVPNHLLESEELIELCDLLLLKFRQYLAINNFNWRNFVYFNTGQNYINVYIYYEELPEDTEPFLERYRMALREKVTPDYGMVYDEELDKELEKESNNVN